MGKAVSILKFVIGIGLLAALIAYFDVASVAETLVEASPLHLIGVLVLLVVSLLVKGYRWHNLVKLVKSGARYLDAVVSFAGGFIVSYFTPGRMMEPIRGLVYKRLTKTPFASSAPLILVERIGDLLFLLLVAFIGLYLSAQLTGPFFGIVVVSGLLLLCLLAVIMSKRIGKVIKDIGLRLPFASGKKELVESIFKNFYTGMHDLKSRGWVSLLLLTFASWLIEALVLMLSLGAFGVEIALPSAMFVVALATVVGLLSTIPAGLGAMDASMVFILGTFGIGEAVALSGVLVYRFTGIAFLIICAAVVFFRFGAIPNFSRK